jgi:midasin
MLVEGLGNLRTSLSGSSAGASEAGGVLSVLMQSQHSRFAAAVPSLVAPALETLSDLASGGAPSLAQRGRLWMLIGALRLHLLLPSNGCDPAAKYSHQRDHFEELLADKRLEIEVRETVERLATGGAADDADVVRLVSDVSDLVNRVQQLASKVVPRPEPPQFGALFEEVTRFTASSARVEKVVSLVNGALSGQSGAGELGVWQGNLGHLIARLTKEYPAYWDVAQPVQLAAYELRYGAALLAAAQVEQAGFGAGKDSSSPGGRAELEELLSWLMEFPVTRSEGRFSEVAAKQGKSPANAGFLEKWVDERAQQQLSSAVVRNSREAPAIELQMKVLQLVATRAAQAAAASGLVSQESLEVLDRAFGSLVRLWSEVKEKRAEKEREEAELYKYKVRSHVIKTEEEEAEAGYKEMFPNYFEQYADIEGEPEMASAEEDDRRAAAAEAAAAGGLESDASQKASWNLLQELVSPVVRLHNQVFGQAAEVRTPPSPSKKGKPKKEAAISKEGGGEAGLLSSFTASYDTGVQLLHHGLGLIAGPEVEKQTASGHLLRVSLEHRRLSRRPNPDASAMDIHSENPPELALALQPLGGVGRRLGVLLAEWPDHPILQQLHKICERVLSLPPSTPVVKALVGLELLLNKAQIWQEGAARHVSLAAELDEVARLVARWRKAELASWPSLLEQVRMWESIRGRYSVEFKCKELCGSEFHDI